MTAIAAPANPGRKGGARESGGRTAGRDITPYLVAPAALLILALFVYPFVYGLVLSFNPAKGAFLDNYARFFSEERLYDTISTTLWLALPATLVNLAMALPMAYQMRKPSSLQRVVTLLLVVPVTLGTVLIAEGMLTYLGPQGWLVRALHWTGLLEGPLRLTHNYWGVLLSLIISGFPFAFLLILSYVTGIDPVLARAAATLGASPGRQFRHIYLPLLAPGLAVTFSLSFVQAFSVFPSAVLLGAPAGPTRVISIAAYQAAFEDFDYSMASAIAMIMGAVQLAVLLGVGALRGLAYRGPASGAKG